MKIELTKEEALVLSDWLYRNSKKNEYFDDDAEKYVLWHIASQLDKELTEPLSKDYLSVLAKARKTVKEEY
ncbi:MAG: hypothetical protein IKL92_06430 [Oscillospiraceae bacterium]|nr:hypothetical protein [Oscillospiraceae bacterium]